MTRRFFAHGLVVFFTFAGAALAENLPDSALNQQSGAIEIAYPTWSGSNLDIDYVVNSGNGLEVFHVTTHPLDDLRPRLAVAPDGDAWIAWWRDDATDQVLIRRRHFAAGIWDAERVISTGDESSRNPAVTYDGTDAWVVYEVDAPGGNTGVVVRIVIDEPDPVGVQVVLAETDFDTPDVKIHSEQGQLWVTWVDSVTEVGWSRYDYQNETWSLPSFESYLQDSVADARDRIHQQIVD